jgi:uncharacterized protein (TIGR02001 family)
MKKAFQLKSLLLSMAVAGAATMAITPVTAQAGVSANVGMVSNYVYRGVEQTTDASASAGLDYDNESGFYLGLWGADVGGGDAGLEYDIYGGWAGDFKGVSLGLGATGYYYTGDFDTSYQEVNTSIGYGPISVGYDIGTWEEGGVGTKDSDYTDLSISAEYEGFSATYGKWDPDTDSSVKDDSNTYLEVGYGAELAKGLDGSITYIKSDFEDSTVADKDYLVFGITKTFDIM